MAVDRRLASMVEALLAAGAEPDIATATVASLLLGAQPRGRCWGDRGVARARRVVNQPRRISMARRRRRVPRGSGESTPSSCCSRPASMSTPPTRSSTETALMRAAAEGHEVVVDRLLAAVSRSESASAGHGAQRAQERGIIRAAASRRSTPAARNGWHRHRAPARGRRRGTDSVKWPMARRRR